MNITPVNNTSFQALHIRTNRINSSGIHRIERSDTLKKLAKNYEVIISHQKPKGYNKGLLKVMSISSASILTPLAFMTQALKTSMSEHIQNYFAYGMPSLATAVTALAAYMIYSASNDKREIIVQAGTGVEDDIFCKPKLNGVVSNKHIFDEYELDDIASECQEEVENRIIFKFYEMIVDKYNTDNITLDTIQEIIDDKDIQKYLSDGRCFNRKVNDKDTLLSSFLDIIPDKTNQKKYDKLIVKMQSMRHIDFNQKDDLGISAIEKVLASENPVLLDLAKYSDLNYSKEMDLAYENISDIRFKESAKQLNVNFVDITSAIEKRVSPYTIKQLIQEECKSPFFNQKQMNNILKLAVKLGDYNVVYDAFHEAKDILPHTLYEVFI